jgi:hypothetical protein
VRDLVLADADIVAHIDFHSFGQLILYPWAFDEIVPPAEGTFAALADMLHDAILGVHEETYEAKQGVYFYPAAGIMPDWTYGHLGIYGLTIELRPAGTEEGDPPGFVLPPEHIVPTCEEALAAVLVLANWSIEREPGSPGGDWEIPPGVTGTGPSDPDTTSSGATGPGLRTDSDGDSRAGGTDSQGVAVEGATVTHACVCHATGARRGRGGPVALGLVVLAVCRRRARAVRARPRASAPSQNGMSSSPGSDGA